MPIRVAARPSRSEPSHLGTPYALRKFHYLVVPKNMQSVHIPTLRFDDFAEVAGRRSSALVRAAVDDIRDLLGDRIVWHVNSTKTGGGVAEMLQTLLGYERGAGLDSRWLVIEGEPDFFTVTKRLHHRFHGNRGDGGSLGDMEREVYERVAKRSAAGVLSVVRKGDVPPPPQAANVTALTVQAAASV